MKFLLLRLLCALLLSGCLHGNTWSAASAVEPQGNALDLAEPPRRIVSLAPSVTEMLFALDSGDRLVGVTEFSTYPPEALRIPVVGSYKNFSIETILSLNPDLVIGISDGNPREALDQLRRLRIPLYVINPITIPDMIETLVHLGRITGNEVEGARLAARLASRLERIQTLSRNLPKPVVLLQIERAPVVTINGETLQSRLIELAGGKNLAEDEPVRYPRYSVESILAKQPEVIILSSMETEASLQAELDRWRKYTALPAVRNNRLYVIQSDLIARAAPRILDGLETLFTMIHPEIPIDCRQTP